MLCSTASQRAFFSILTKSIATIVVSVTSKRAGNAPSGLTPEVTRGTSGRRTILVFIWIVQTIVISVTNPSFGNTSLIIASKIPRIGTSLHRRFGIRITLASFLVWSQFFAVRTSANGFNSVSGWIWGHGKTQFLTVTVIIVTGVFFDDFLSFFRVDFNAVKSVWFFDFFDDFFVGARGLFHLDNGV